jgi:hypothetical protein
MKDDMHKRTHYKHPVQLPTSTSKPNETCERLYREVYMYDYDLYVYSYSYVNVYMSKSIKVYVFKHICTYVYFQAE